MLNIQNCTFSYSRRGEKTIDNFSMSMEPGCIYGLLGSNGAGKTTLLQLIMGLLTPESGEVTFDGKNTRLRLPSVAGELYLVPEEIELPPIKAGAFIKYNSVFYPRFSHDDMLRYLEWFGLEPGMRLDRLSMGQKKKFAIAFAISCNTRALLMDEPTNGLDIPSKSTFRKIVASAASDDKTIVISTHQVKDISRILDRICIMDNRKVLLNRSVAEIQSKIKFAETSNAEIPDDAYYAVKGLGGASVILPNRDGDDSELNLELLYEFAISQSQKLNLIFKS